MKIYGGERRTYEDIGRNSPKTYAEIYLILVGLQMEPNELNLGLTSHTPINFRLFLLASPWLLPSLPY